MLDSGSNIRGWRAWILIVAGIYIGAVLITPAQAHFRSSISHILDHAREIFYTKTQANSRFVNVGEKASDSDLLDGMDASAFLGATEKAADSDLLDGVDSAALARKLDNVVTVSSTGGDFDSIQAAIDSITDSSLGNPYLVMVGPGSYSERVTLKSGIVLEGSGVTLTDIRAGGAELCPDAFVVKTAAGSEVRDLRIFNGGFEACAVGVLNDGVSSSFANVTIHTELATAMSFAVQNKGGGAVTLEDASVEAFAFPSEPAAIAAGVDQAAGSNLNVRRSFIMAESNGGIAAYGLRNDASNSTLEDTTVLASGTGGTSRIGIRNQNNSGNSVTVRRSTVSALDMTISSTFGYGVAVMFSVLDGGAVSGPATCAAVVDENVAFSGSTCP